MIVKKIHNIEEKAFNNMDKTWFEDDKGTFGYTFMRTEEGKDINASWSMDKKGKNIAKKNQESQTAYTPKSKTFEADPNKISSIEWQTSIKEARQLVKDWHDLSMLNGETPSFPSIEDYKKEIVNAAITLASAIGKKPDNLIPTQEYEDTTTADDLPPVENYDNPVDLADVPF